MKFEMIIALQALLVGTTTASKRNRIAGVWELESASSTTGNQTSYYLGDNPHGILIFTKSGSFAAQVNRGDLPLLPEDSISNITDEDLLAVAQGTFGISGTYEVDENGDFESQVIQGCTSPNSIGLYRNTSMINFVVSEGGQTLQEHATEGPEASSEHVWKRRS